MWRDGEEERRGEEAPFCVATWLAALRLKLPKKFLTFVTVMRALRRARCLLEGGVDAWSEVKKRSS